MDFIFLFTYKGHGLFSFEVHQSHPLGLTVPDLWLSLPWVFSQLLLSLQVFHFHLDQSSKTCLLLFSSPARRRKSMKDESNCCAIRKSVRLQYVNSSIVFSFIKSTTFLFKHSNISVIVRFFFFHSEPLSIRCDHSWCLTSCSRSNAHFYSVNKTYQWDLLDVELAIV